MSTIDDQPTPGPENVRILIWQKSNGTVDLLSIIRQLPFCLQQYQYVKQIPLDPAWTYQPLAATRIAWVMDASSRTFPDFITQSLPDLVKPRKTLTDLDQDENRGVFWLKIIRELAPKIGISTENLHLIHQILTARAIASFLSRLSDKSITYEKPLYGNALPFIDIDEPMAWCIFIDEMGNHVDARTGQITEQLKIVTDPSEIEKWYSQNLATRGTIVRPRYLTMIEHPYLPNGAIELYGAAVRKDVDVLRNQLKEFSGNSYTSDQINAHVQTIRNRLQGIPRVLWGSTDLITETVAKAKEACQNASISTEKVTINVLRSVVIDYLMSNYE
ncbi:unnamed protein product [Rotaria sp. Silwood2]|nr:unnamed protein product [Rotaria sp. Silwood2]CAF4380953.1 unnamed protein product [Rotaria sp. Silwood2]